MRGLRHRRNCSQRCWCPAELTAHRPSHPAGLAVHRPLPAPRQVLQPAGVGPRRPHRRRVRLHAPLPGRAHGGGGGARGRGARRGGERGQHGAELGSAGESAGEVPATPPHVPHHPHPPPHRSRAWSGAPARCGARTAPPTCWPQAAWTAACACGRRRRSWCERRRGTRCGWWPACCAACLCRRQLVVQPHLFRMRLVSGASSQHISRSRQKGGGPTMRGAQRR